MWHWDANLARKSKGPFAIKVVIDEQKAKLYLGKTQVGWTYVATGVTKHPTPLGSFYIMERTSDKHSNLYGRIYDAKGECVNEDAKSGRDPVPEGGKFVGSHLQYWMRVTEDGVGMHVGPIPRPGHRASHGCVRLPRDAAKHIFSQARYGTPVFILQSDDGAAPAAAAVKVPPLGRSTAPAASAATTAATAKPAAKPARTLPAAPSPAAPGGFPSLRPPAETAMPVVPR